MADFYPEGKLINTTENQAYLKSLSTLAEACHEGRILEARAIICDITSVCRCS